MIYSSNPKAGYLKYKDEINQSIQDVLNSDRYIKGRNVYDFESNFSQYIQTKFAIGVGNATDAIYLCLRALGVGSGDEVITVSLTATGTIAAIVNTGASPVFIDIDNNYFTINLNDIEAKINQNTKALVVVHLYGQSCDMEKVLDISKKHNLPVIEDCAQASGSKYKSKRVGSIGTLGCFSFFPTKNLSCVGDGGLVTTNDVDLYEKIKSLSQYGWDENRDAQAIGINSRLDELQAAILKVKLKYLDLDNEERRNIANGYQSRINNPKIIHPSEAEYSFHVYHLYVIRVENGRDELIKYLNNNGVYPGIHYPLPVHMQKSYIQYLKNDSVKNTERIVKQIVSLPIYQGMKIEHVDKIVNLLNNY